MISLNYEYSCCVSVFLHVVITNNHAQITISNANPYNNSNHLINNVLLGGGVSANNVTYQGDPIQVVFNAINSNLGIDSGIVLSTGDIIDLDPSGFGSGNILLAQIVILIY